MEITDTELVALLLAVAQTAVAILWAIGAYHLFAIMLGWKPEDD